MSVPLLKSLQVGKPREYAGDEDASWMRRPWATGIFKSAVAGPVRLRMTNLDGDGQADLAVHGGPDKAVCVYSADHYPFWKAALAEALGEEQEAPEIPYGAFGENFSVEGLTEADVCIGDVWAVGDAAVSDGAMSGAMFGENIAGAVVQVSQPRQPCWKLARKWRIKTFTYAVQQTGKTGWYFRVMREGVVEAGMNLTLQERPQPEWTVERANEVMYGDESDSRAAAALWGVTELSASWRESMRNRM